MNKRFLIVVLYLSCINAKIDFSQYKEIETKECTILIPKDLVLKEKEKNYGLFKFAEKSNLKSLKLPKEEFFSDNIQYNIKSILRKYYLNSNDKKMFIKKRKDSLQFYGFKKYDLLEHNKTINEFLIRGKYLMMILNNFSKKEADDIFRYCIQTKIED